MGKYTEAQITEINRRAREVANGGGRRNNVVALRAPSLNASGQGEVLEDAATGAVIYRRYATRYWFDARMKEPSRFARGYPKAEDGSIEGAGRVIMKGYCAKVQCYDRVEGRVLWTLRRGPKLAGTRLFTVTFHRGEV